MRAVKVFLFSLASLLGLLIVGIVGLVVYQSIDKEDTFVLEHASLRDPDYLKRFAAMDAKTRRQNRSEEFHAASHRLTRGEGTIFAYRHYSNGRITAIDDELYRKVTIWFREIPESNHSTIELNDPRRAILVLSHGGSAWPEAGCSGYATSGTVRIARNGARYEITVTADVPMQNPLRDGCETEHVHVSFDAARIAFEDLTPWLGLQGDHPYAETYR